MGKDAGKVEVNWLVDGQAVNCTRKHASSSLTVNRSVSLVAVFRLNGFEMKKNISIKINEENSGGYLSGWKVAVITTVLVIAVAITISAIVWFMRKKKRGCFKTESNGSEDEVVDGETTQNADSFLMGETPADEEKQVQQLSENDKTNREKGPEQETLGCTIEEEQETVSSSNPLNVVYGVYKSLWSSKPDSVETNDEQDATI
ncbi:uncharacterized protein LOC127861021 [Dreissena polymorpha]|uniref:uncharacterized protein LOC127861021 n=1 Tax=Dreissena polymorpha TaxID=45954 RepID=UPI002265020F|nr:uncharacterized protein LOC127861021 [Dreissena polymorpha]